MAWLTGEVKWKVIFEWKRCKTVQLLACTCRVHRATVNRWVLRHQSEGCVQPIRHQGPNALISAEAAKAAMAVLVSGEYIGANEVA